MTNNPTEDTSDPFATKQSTHAFFQRLEKLRFDCGAKTSKHDQACALIMACIDEGITQGKRIVGILHTLGFNRQHVGKTLFQYSGINPDKHYWWTDEEGSYRLHPNPALEAAAKIKV